MSLLETVMGGRKTAARGELFCLPQERVYMPSGKNNKDRIIIPVSGDGKSPKMFVIPQKSRKDKFFDSGAQFMIALNLLGWIGWLIYPSKDYIIFWTIFSLLNILAITRIMQMMDSHEKILNEIISSDKDTVNRLNESMEKYRNEKNNKGGN